MADVRKAALIEDNTLKELFCAECEQQTDLLSKSLIELESSMDQKACLEKVMRCAHSLKGAARLLGFEQLVRLTHAMESCVVAAQQGGTRLEQGVVEGLLRATDFLARFSDAKDPAFCASSDSEVDSLIAGFTATSASSPKMDKAPALEAPSSAAEVGVEAAAPKEEATSRVLRVSAHSMDALIATAGEGLVQHGAFEKWITEIGAVRRMLASGVGEVRRIVDGQAALEKGAAAESAAVRAAYNLLADCETKLTELGHGLEEDMSRARILSNRVYHQALGSRKRPFSDLVGSFQRIVRDTGSRLGKRIQLDFTGQNTLIDRDLVKQLEVPIQQLLRNAIDHGIEDAATRNTRGKTEQGNIRVDVRSNSRVVLVKVSDDGGGLDVELIKASIVRKGLAQADVVARMTLDEIYEFIFLPGFSVRDVATDISGRGVGLDIVQSTVRSCRGNIWVRSEAGKGTTFEIQLPLSMQVSKALIFGLGGHKYAIPLVQLAAVLKVESAGLQYSEGRAFLMWNGEATPVFDLGQVLEVSSAAASSEQLLPILIVTLHGQSIALVVDEIQQTEDLVLQSLESHFGRVQDVSAASVTRNGEVVILLNVEDIATSLSQRSLGSFELSRPTVDSAPAQLRKRVLVVDDSITVRELERKLLQSKGYDVTVAVDGADGWNMLTAGSFDLLITDVDMPRLNGFELVTLARESARTRELPIIIVSYKERPEDRIRGLEVGADYYLTKGSFHDRSFLDAVDDLIGAGENE